MISLLQKWTTRKAIKLLVNLLFIFLALPTFAKEDNPVFIISSEKNSAYELAEQGIIEVLGDQYNVRIFDLDEGKKRFPFRDIDRSKPLAIITVGSLASKTAYIDSKEGNISAPIIISMVLRPDVNKIRPSRRLKVTGVTLDIPYDQQFNKLRELLPEIKKIGFIYHASNRERVADAIKIAEDCGIRLVAAEVSNSKQLTKAIDQLINDKKIELFWPGVDLSMYTKEVLQYLIHKTNQKRIPFVGHSFKYLEWGALLSLDVNYKEIGRQTGVLALDIINKHQRLEPRFYTPSQGIRYSLNLVAADKLGINFSKPVIENAYFSIK